MSMKNNEKPINIDGQESNTTINHEELAWKIIDKFFN